jgi:hypothetical protein
MKAISILLIGLLFSFASFSQVSKVDSYLLWSDEFDQDGLPSPLRWSFEVGDHGWGNNELQFYKANDLKNARVQGGVLVLEFAQGIYLR